jgi:hypothetical protein
MTGCGPSKEEKAALYKIETRYHIGKKRWESFLYVDRKNDCGLLDDDELPEAEMWMESGGNAIGALYEAHKSGDLSFAESHLQYAATADRLPAEGIERGLL